MDARGEGAAEAAAVAGVTAVAAERTILKWLPSRVFHPRRTILKWLPSRVFHPRRTIFKW
jgi:hypothetical protein